MRVERNQIAPAPQQLQAVMPGPYVLVQSQTGGMQMVQMADMSMVMPMQPPVSARRRSGAGCDAASRVTQTVVVSTLVLHARERGLARSSPVCVVVVAHHRGSRIEYVATARCRQALAVW